MHGDTSRTFLVGDVVRPTDISSCIMFTRVICQDEQGCDLVKTTLDALHAGIAVCGPHVPFKSIGRAIHDLARRRGYSVSEQFTGHGIGSVFHRPPWIVHTGG
jgi:methionyl aminopeptidase